MCSVLSGKKSLGLLLQVLLLRCHYCCTQSDKDSRRIEIYNTLSFCSSSQRAQGVPLCNSNVHAVDPLPHPSYPPCSFTPSGPMLRHQQVPARAYTRASMVHAIGRRCLSIMLANSDTIPFFYSYRERQCLAYGLPRNAADGHFHPAFAIYGVAK